MSHRRDVAASRNLATVTPAVVCRCSTAVAALPTSVTIVSFTEIHSPVLRALAGSLAPRRPHAARIRQAPPRPVDNLPTVDNSATRKGGWSTPPQPRAVRPQTPDATAYCSRTSR
ncbi:hypothetical protein HEK616_07160 [Streptomyces nigrescens]|uniref:Secreted protein n=1 Tax=Streptomyces nigrescens TaxID=1920 RepID=A0ABN6QLZ7_STRNI|nr:hypothetical protein HEK616_07160 [Streptomyces nigrescens]